MGGMIWLEGTGQILGAKEGKVLTDREDLGFRVKMGRGTHLHAACRNAEGTILEDL